MVDHRKPIPRLNVSLADGLLSELGCITTALHLMTEDGGGLDEDGKPSVYFLACLADEKVRALDDLMREARK